MSIRYLLIICVIVMVYGPAPGQDKIDAIVRLAGDAALKNGNMSFTIFDMASGELVAAHNPNMSLIPASSLKILTCAYGLKTLGKDFKFKTDLEINGPIDQNGVLQGDLIIKGYGDPTLGSEMTNSPEDLERVLVIFANAVKAAGIRSVNGRVFGDGSFLSNEGIYDTWLWNDIGNYYGAGVYGLNIFDNLFKLKFKQTRQGASPSIASTFPNIPGLQFASKVLCAGPNSGDNAYIYGGPLQYNRQVKGTIPSGAGVFEIKGSLPDPPLTAAMLLAQKLEKTGISSKGFAGSLKDPLPEGKRRVIETYTSKSLHYIVNQTILKSINLNAEAILRYCDAVHHPSGNTNDAITSFVTFLEKNTENQSGFFLCDGSGLSTYNSVPSYGFARVLLQLLKDPSISHIITGALPVAGSTGTLKNYLKNSKAAGHIRAKTGSMDRVRSFSGVMTSVTGKEYVFSLIINNYSCTSSQIKTKVEAFFTDLYLSL